MGDQNARLKKAASQAATSCGADFGQLMRDGLADFLADGFDDGDHPNVIAAKVLASLCCGGKHDRVVAHMVMLFLSPRIDDECDRCARDLRELVDREADYAAYLAWANANFQ
jgi:hypothetical protein